MESKKYAPISTEELLRVARLVRIGLSKYDVEYYSRELGSVVTWFSIVSEVDTDGVTPMHYGRVSGILPTRRDVVCDDNLKNEVLSSDKTEYGYFVVQKVIV